MGTKNKKAQRRASLQRQVRRLVRTQEEQKFIKQTLADFNEELRAPAIQLVFPFYHQLEIKQ